MLCCVPTARCVRGDLSYYNLLHLWRNDMYWDLLLSLMILDLTTFLKVVKSDIQHIFTNHFLLLSFYFSLFNAPAASCVHVLFLHAAAHRMVVP